MTSEQHFVIVGGGLAAAKVAEALRADDFAGSVTLLAAEEHLPYERPPLSKEHLLGAKPLTGFTVQGPQWYRDHHIELRLGTTVTALDPAGKSVTLPDGTTIRYDKLALATGAAPRRLPIPGADADRVYTLRTIEDSDGLIALFAAIRRIAIIGAGWIGLEVAAAARAAGVEVTIVETAPQPLLAALGPEMGAMFADLHLAHGVQLLLNTQVTEIVTEPGDPTETATGIRLADGTVVDADAVLIAVGAAPNVELARSAGLAVGSGVLVDASLTTSDPDIVAVGDIAEQQHPVLGQRIRLEHWANALNQPAVAAATMLGRTAVYDRLPYFFTDQYDTHWVTDPDQGKRAVSPGLSMEYRGYVGPEGYDRVVFRGDVETYEFVAFWLKDGRVLAGMNVNVWDVGAPIEALIRSRKVVLPELLADTSVPLGEIAT